MNSGRTRSRFEDLVHPSWVPILAEVEPALREAGDFLRSEVAAGHRYQPAGEAILRAFSIPLPEVKVLILGQDPYPREGQAVGLAFAVPPGTLPLPPSLVNIALELRDDLGVELPPDLSSWTQEGVLLLNRVLTVRPGASGSHRGHGWEALTMAAVSGLAQRPGPLVAVLWGRDAQAVRGVLGSVPVVASAHPSPLSARRGFFGSRPFSQVNRLLAEQGASPVHWGLRKHP